MQVNNPKIIVTESAKARLLEILEKDEIFKISVQPGGCNGFEYKFNVEKYEKDFKKDLDIKNNDPKEGECHLAATECKKGHLIYLKDMLLILIDAVSLKMINGSTLDYTKDLMSEKFVILKNPNSGSSCSCGASFG